MQVEQARSEFKRLRRQSPFRPFIVRMSGGEHALIEHPENVAFDPRPSAASDFYVVTGGLRLVGTFDMISSITMLADNEARDNGEHTEQQA